MTIAFYNEIDPYAAQWLRNLIAAGHIAPGIVDERDIRDIRPEELFQYDQCHFFAGIGVWPFALRRAGWEDSRPIWTGSCPCQPFSAAGRAGGFTDERHLWPHWYHLITQCHPPVVAGEQVASKDGLGWLDLVSSDLEGASYAFGASDLCAAGITVEWEVSQAGEWLQRAIHDCGDPVIATMLRDFADWAGAGNLGTGGEHIRQRLYFVGVADSTDEQQHGRGDARPRRRLEYPVSGGADWMDHHHHQGSQRHTRHDGEALGHGQGSERSASEAGISDGVADDDDDDGFTASPLTGFRDAEHHAEPRRGSERVADAGHARLERCDARSMGFECEAAERDRCSEPSDEPSTNAPPRRQRFADWLFCRDGKWRPVGPGSFPLAHGAPARVGRLRAYGNGLDGETVTEFVTTIKAILDGEPDAVACSDSILSFEDILG